MIGRFLSERWTRLTTFLLIPFVSNFLMGAHLLFLFLLLG